MATAYVHLDARRSFLDEAFSVGGHYLLWYLALGKDRQAFYQGNR